MSDRAGETKREIIQFLNTRQQSAFTKEIAQSLRLAIPTVSKYLEVLYAEGHVEKDDEKKPYIFWKLKENGVQKRMGIIEK